MIVCVNVIVVKTVLPEIDLALRELEKSFNYVRFALESGVGGLRTRTRILLRYAKNAGERAVEPVLDFFSQLSISQKENFLYAIHSVRKPVLDSPAVRKLFFHALRDESGVVRETGAEMVFNLEMKDDYYRAAQIILDGNPGSRQYSATRGNQTIAENAAEIINLPMLFALQIGNQKNLLDYRMHIANTMIDSMDNCPDIRTQAIYFVKNENIPYEVRHELVRGFGRTGDLDSLKVLKSAPIRQSELVADINSELNKQVAIKKMARAKMAQISDVAAGRKNVATKTS